MKTKLITMLLLLSSVYLKSQNATAYTYFFVLNNLSGKDVYLFTSPKAFTYAKGSTYVFSPVEYERIVKLTIEKKLKSMDPSFTGLYVNQIMNGTNTALGNYQNIYSEIQDKMLKIYQTEQNETYRGNGVEIILIDMDTGKLLTEYTLPSTTTNKKNGSAGNAY